MGSGVSGGETIMVAETTRVLEGETTKGERVSGRNDLLPLLQTNS